MTGEAEARLRRDRGATEQATVTQVQVQVQVQARGGDAGQWPVGGRGQVPSSADAVI